MKADFYHVGIVVSDLSAALRDLSSTLGLTWTPEQRREMTVRYKDKLVERRTHFAYSLQGPPYVEMIAVTEPPWDVSTGLHHSGFWSDDIVKDMEEMLADQATHVANGVGSDGEPDRFAYVRNATGLLVELVDRRLKPGLDGLLRGESYP